MMTPKQALIKDGTIPVKPGKGRLSHEAIARCKELVSQGWVIDGYSADNSDGEVKRVATTNEKIVSEVTILYPESSYRAVVEGMKFTGPGMGMREVCNNCRVSLVQCHCGNPTILGDLKVKIMPR